MNFRTTPPRLSDFPPLRLPDLKVCELSGGMRISYLNGGDQPVNRITLSYPQGTADVDSPAAMLILSRLMKEGSTQHSAVEISDILDFNGAWLKADPSRHFFDIHLHSINSRLPKVIGLLKETVATPLLPEKEFLSLRQQMATAADTRARTAETMARKESTRLFFGDRHPFAKLPPGPEDFLAVSLDDVKDLHRRLIASIRPEISVAGDCDTLIPLIEAIFSELASLEESVGPVYVPPTSCCPARLDTVLNECCQSAVNLDIPSIPRSHPDYIDLRYAIVALGGYFGSRLMKQIREKQGLTYGITAQLLGHNEGTEMLIASQTDPSYTETLIHSVSDVIEGMRHEPITDEELTQLKAYCMSSLAATLDSPFSIIDYQATIRRMQCGADYFMRQQTHLQSLTSERITEVLDRHLDLSDAIITVAGPQIVS